MPPRRFQITFHMYPSDIPYASQMPSRNNIGNLQPHSNDILETCYKQIRNTPNTIIQVLDVFQIPSTCLLYASCTPYRSIQDAYARHSRDMLQARQRRARGISGFLDALYMPSSKCGPDALLMHPWFRRYALYRRVRQMHNYRSPQTDISVMPCIQNSSRMFLGRFQKHYRCIRQAHYVARFKCIVEA